MAAAQLRATIKLLTHDQHHFSMYYVYLLKSIKFGKTYIGSTKDLRRRLKEHNAGISFSTKPFLPWKLIYYEAFDDERAARSREKNLKYNGNAVRELKKRVFLSKSGAGYTLIEILVALTIIGILFGFGYVSYRDFNRRQALAGVAKQVQGDLRLAQQMALSGQKPDDPKCKGTNTLVGYYFGTYFSGPNTIYVVGAHCSGGNPTVTKSVTLPNGITLTSSPSLAVLFKVLGQGTSIPSGSNLVITLTQAGTNATAVITIDSGGNIQ